VQLDLTEDQELFHSTTLRFVEEQLPIAATRALHDDPNGFDRGWLRRCADLGWFAMLVPEALGGGSVSGSGIRDAALVADVIGRHVQPGPFVGINVVASALAAGGSDRLQSEVLPKLVGGESVATWAPLDRLGQPDDGAGVTATRDGDQVRLSGTRGFVLDGASADHVLVSAALEGEPVQVLVPKDTVGMTTVALSGLDLSRRFAHLTLTDVIAPADALVGDAAAIGRLHLIAVVLNVADTVGAMDALFDMTVEYAKDRVAFGRPIGSFQALKHVLADEALHLETAKAVSDAAAQAVATNAADVTEVVAMAAAYVGERGNELAQQCLQVHGGIGYTWEHDLHLLMRRIQSNSALFGEPSWHRARVCDLHLAGQEAAS
jgi:alkylation response protein AidB-like acyl-CoA dehydrogenase